MSYQISLEVFEGPLDLLLHLIRKNKLDIYDIPISMVAEQYIEYLSAMREIDMEVASEFIVTASTLLDIKAKMLLPKHQLDDDEPMEDPRFELVQRLLEYQQYKSVIDQFQQMETKSSRVYSKPVDEELIHRLSDGVNPLENVTYEELSQLFLEILERVPPQEPVTEIARKEITIGSVMKSLRALMKEKRDMVFQDVVSGVLTRYEIIIYFLAVLELVRKEELIVRQSESFGPIRLLYVEEKVM